MPITTTGVGSPTNTGGSPPVNSTSPVVSGIPNTGQVLTTSNGIWTNSPTQYDYQWFSGSSPVGIDQNTYTLQTSDIAAFVYAVVTASNTSGGTQATSNSVGPITNIIERVLQDNVTVRVLQDGVTIRVLN